MPASTSLLAAQNQLGANKDAGKSAACYFLADTRDIPQLRTAYCGLPGNDRKLQRRLEPAAGGVPNMDRTACVSCPEHRQEFSQKN